MHHYVTRGFQVRLSAGLGATVRVKQLDPSSFALHIGARLCVLHAFVLKSSPLS